MSLIGDYFTAERRGRAVSIFQSAAFLGLISMAVTGVIAERHGWRAPFLVAGAAGILLAILLFFTAVEPRAGRPRSEPASASSSLLTSTRILMGSPVYVLLVVGITAGAVSAASLSTWASAFLIRIHGLSVVEAASAVGPASGLGGFLGTLVGGYATSWMVNRTGSRQWSLILPGIALLLAVPAVIVFLFADAPALAIAMFGLQAFLWAIKTGPCYALALELVPTELRAFAVSVLIVVGGVVGTGLGPPFVGFMSDTLGSWGGVMTLQLALVVAPAALLVAGVALLSAARMLK
jgi:MFS family permease